MTSMPTIASEEEWRREPATRSWRRKRKPHGCSMRSQHSGVDSRWCALTRTSTSSRRRMDPSDSWTSSRDNRSSLCTNLTDVGPDKFLPGLHQLYEQRHRPGHAGQEWGQLAHRLEHATRADGFLLDPSRLGCSVRILASDRLRCRLRCRWGLLAELVPHRRARGVSDLFDTRGEVSIACCSCTTFWISRRTDVRRIGRTPLKGGRNIPPTAER